MRHVWTMAAQSSAVDYETGTLSLFNLLEELHLPGAPPNAENVNLAPIAMQLVSLWQREEGDGETCFWGYRLENGRGETLTSEEGKPVEFAKAPRSRTRYQMIMFPIKGEGIYRFLMTASRSKDGPFVDIGSVSIEVSFAPIQSFPRFTRVAE
jgi:hypothetical protein